MAWFFQKENKNEKEKKEKMGNSFFQSVLIALMRKGRVPRLSLCLDFSEDSGHL